MLIKQIHYNPQQYFNNKGEWHGPIRTFHKNGKLSWDGYKINGKWTSMFKDFYENGILALVDTNKNNVRNGIKFYYENRF